MIDYKIRVNNEAESKKAQELFLEYDATGIVCLDKSISYVCTFKGVLTQYEFLPNVEFKQITLPELRDLVVLKRNSEDDAQLIDSFGDKWFVDSDGGYWVFERKVWRPALKPSFALKPIEKTMKEYLVKDNTTSKYCFIKSEGLDADGSDVIELPKGTELVVQRKDGTKEYFKDGCCRKYRSDKLWHHVSIPFAHIEESNLIWLKEGCQAYCDPKYSSKLPSPFNYVKKRETVLSETNHQKPMNESGYLLQGKNCEHLKVGIHELKQPEELPIIDDEQSLNDQYAEIEKVRGRHSHYKKDISHLEVLDVYRVLELFNVTNPCIQHAVKKLLCSGQRGVKDSDRDVNEAIDSLQRYNEMKIEDENSSED